MWINKLHVLYCIVLHCIALHCVVVSIIDMYPPTFSTTPRQTADMEDSSSESNTTAAASEQSSATPAESLAPPGMSVAAVKRVTADSPLDPNKLEQVIKLEMF